jgi:hypothetical protein
LKLIFRVNDELYHVAAMAPPPGTERARASLVLAAHVYTLAFDWLKLA